MSKTSTKARSAPAGGYVARHKGARSTVVDNAAPAGTPDSYAGATSVEVTKGEVPEDRPDDKVVPERTARGVRGKVDGDPYVAVGGPHAGEVMQPIREAGTGSLLSVPVSRLRRTGGGGCSTPRVGYSPAYAAGFDRIFGKRKG